MESLRWEIHPPLTPRHPQLFTMVLIMREVRVDRLDGSPLSNPTTRTLLEEAPW